MLSVVVDQPNSMAVRERPMPEPQAGEVRVRVRYAGICGSDLHIFHGKNPFVVLSARDRPRVRRPHRSGGRRRRPRARIGETGGGRSR